MQITIYPTIAYPAVIEYAGAGFSAYFPDLPGCTSAGETIKQASLNAVEALASYLAVITKDGQIAPLATPVEEISPYSLVDTAGIIALSVPDLTAGTAAARAPDYA